MLVKLSGNVISANVHWAKAPSPILVMLPNILISERRVQPENVLLSIVVTPSGIVTFFISSQPEKAAPPMVVTLEGIVISRRR